MRLIADTTSRVLALGGDALTASAGQEVRATARTFADLAAAEAQVAALGGPGEVWHDAPTDTLRARTRAATADEAARTLVVQAAQSAVGVGLAALTPAQVRALLEVVLWKLGAIDSAGLVLPLSQWAH